MVTTIPSLADRFTWLIDGLCKVIGAEAHKRRMEAALAWAIWNRVQAARGAADRARGAGAGGAGRHLTPALSRRAEREKITRRRSPGRRAGRLQVRRTRSACRRGSGGLRGCCRGRCSSRGCLTYLLRDPEVLALMERAPRQAGRILRPLCHLLGVRAPEILRRGRGAGDSPPPHPASGSSPEARLPPLSAERDDNGGVSVAAHLPPGPPGSILGSSPGTGASLTSRGDGEERGGVGAVVPPPPQPSPIEGAGEMRPQRPLSWLEQDAAAMRERAARWAARHAEPPSTLLPLGMSPTLAFPGTRPIGADSKNRG